MKTWTIIALFYGVTGLIALYWYIKYQLKNKEYEEEIKKEKVTLKERVVLMFISEEVEKYRKGGNAYTAMREIGNLMFSLEKKEDISITDLENTNI